MKKFYVLFLLVIIIFTGCGKTEEKKPVTNENQKIETQSSTSKVNEQKHSSNENEIYVRKDLTGYDCFLLIDSIESESNDIIYCRTANYDGNTIINYKNYKFEIKNGEIFTNDMGRIAALDVNNTPLEYNIINEIIKIKNDNPNDQKLNIENPIDTIATSKIVVS